MEDPVPAPLRRRGTKHPYRRRARIACVCCHDRKVRCDVAVNGNPCTNCRLDGNKCSVKDRGTKLYIGKNNTPKSLILTDHYF